MEEKPEQLELEIKRKRREFEKLVKLKITKENDFKMRINVLKIRYVWKHFSSYLSYKINIRVIGAWNNFEIKGKLIKNWIGIDTIAMCEYATRKNASQQFRNLIFENANVGRYAAPEVGVTLVKNFFLDHKILRGSKFVDEIKERSKNIKFCGDLKIFYKERLIFENYWKCF